MKNLLLLTLLFSITAHAQFITENDFKNSGMRGWNLSAVADLNALKVKNIPAARATGANHGRIWLQMKHAPGSSEYYWCNYKGDAIASPIVVIDSAVSTAKRVGMYLIPTVEVMPKQGADDWWGDSILKNKIIDKWKLLAGYYKNEKVIAAFDLMNEPRVNVSLYRNNVKYNCTVKEYIEFQYKMITEIRKIDSNHVIAIEVLRNEMLGDLALRADSVVFKKTLMNLKNIIYSPHGYSPLHITHQGISSGYPARRTYPDPQNSLYSYYNYFKDRTYWNEPQKFSKKYGKAIWLGEFACVNYAPKNAKGEWTSTKWTQDVITYIEGLGWSWSGHAWEEDIRWNPRIASSWYVGQTFTNGAPATKPPSSAKTDTAPTFIVYRQAFSKNKKYYTL